MRRDNSPGLAKCQFRLEAGIQNHEPHHQTCVLNMNYTVSTQNVHTKKSEALKKMKEKRWHFWGFVSSFLALAEIGALNYKSRRWNNLSVCPSMAPNYIKISPTNSVTMPKLGLWIMRSCCDVRTIMTMQVMQVNRSVEEWAPQSSLKDDWNSPPPPQVNYFSIDCL